MLHHSYLANTMCCKTSFPKGTNKIAAFPEGFGLACVQPPLPSKKSDPDPKIIEGILSRGQHIYIAIYANLYKQKKVFT